MILRPTALALVLMTSTAQADNLFVAGPKGLRQVAFDGKTVRTLSREAARWPRLLPDLKAVLYFAPERGELRRVALDTGAATTVAKLPKQFRLCQPESGESLPEKVEYALSELAVQSDGDFVIDQSGRTACLSLKDRNINMASLDINLHVSLRDGKVAWTEVFPSECPGPKLPECRTRSPAAAKPRKGAYDLQEGWLMAGQKKLVKLGQKGYGIEQVSPGGTWAVVFGNESDGDYIHRTLFLLNQTTGVFYTIAAKPTALSRAQLRKLEGVSSIDAVGESAVRWLRDDVLLIDNQLIWPGKGLVDLQGDIAP